jgi:hypothetical protein
MFMPGKHGRKGVSFLSIQKPILSRLAERFFMMVVAVVCCKVGSDDKLISIGFLSLIDE